MNATILMRIMPDLRSKYSVLVNGERLGDMETLEEAVTMRDRLKERHSSTPGARAILQEEDSRFHP